MKKTILSAVAAVATLAGASGASAATVLAGTSEGVTTDVFNGAGVTSSSAILAGFSAVDAFGVLTPNPTYQESSTGGHVIFENAGANFIEFTTLAPVFINGFRIYVSGDGAGTTFRGFNSVSLFLRTGNTLTLLDSAQYDPTRGPVTVVGSFAPTAGTTFRFEGVGVNGGPRLLEIDAVPEPATWGMMILGFGVMGLGLRSRRKASVRVAHA